MSLQTRLAALVSAIGTDIKTLNTSVVQAAKRAVLVPGASSTVDEDSAVVWKRASDGAYVAYKHVREQGATPNRSYVETDWLDAEAGGTGFASYSHSARVAVGGFRRAASLTMAATPALRSVLAQAENDAGTSFQRKIIDSTGRSDFIQKGSRMDLTNQTADVTFSGLDGEIDMAYELIVMGSLNPNSVSNRMLTARPNGFTGGITTKHRHWRNNDGTQGHDTQVSTDSGVVIGQPDFSTSVAGSFISKTIIGAKVQSNGRRMHSSEWSYIPNTNFESMHGHAGGVYYGPTAPTLDPITSLVVNFSSMTFTGVITLKALL